MYSQKYSHYRKINFFRVIFLLHELHRATQLANLSSLFVRGHFLNPCHVCVLCRYGNVVGSFCSCHVHGWGTSTVCRAGKETHLLLMQAHPPHLRSVLLFLFYNQSFLNLKTKLGQSFTLLIHFNPVCNLPSPYWLHVELCAGGGGVVG